MFLDWDPKDQSKALAWEREMAKVCPSCGSRREEWFDEDDKRRHAPYVAEQETCLGCEVLEQARDQVPSGQGRGLRTFLVRNTDLEF